MKPLKNLVLGFLLLACLFVSCQEDVQPKTPQNFFSCRLNGKLWKPSPNQPGFNELSVTPESGGWLTIKASYRDDNRFEGIDFFSTNITSIGTYPLMKGSPNRCKFIDLTNNIEVRSNDANIDESGELVITKFDMEKGIVAGTFWFKLTKKDGSLTYDAQEGKFNITF